MNLEKIQEMWAKDSEAFFDHRELPELLANDSMRHLVFMLSMYNSTTHSN